MAESSSNTKIQADHGGNDMLGPGGTEAATAAEHVYREIKRRIFFKELRPGQRLPEASLAKTLSVSRTPVREALRTLANEGLVNLAPNTGARLASPTLEEMREGFELREHLEKLAVRRAARHITPLQICMLDEAIKEEESIFCSRDLERYLEVNIRFHRIIAESAKNRILAEYVGNILSRTYVFLVFFESFFDFDTNPSLDEHREIVQALSDHDEDLSEALMLRHIKLSMDTLRKPE
jgi:DNA-binding GntR family transcriptional regulator